MLLKLLPRLKSSGTRLAREAESGDLPSLWPCPGTPSPSERLGPARRGVMVAPSPGGVGVWGLVLVAGAVASEECWGLLRPLLPPAAGARVDGRRGAGLSSFARAREMRRTSRGRLRGAGP